jgi:hypothetical protein
LRELNRPTDWQLDGEDGPKRTFGDSDVVEGFVSSKKTKVAAAKKKANVVPAAREEEEFHEKWRSFIAVCGNNEEIAKTLYTNDNHMFCFKVDGEEKTLQEICILFAK